MITFPGISEYEKCDIEKTEDQYFPSRSRDSYGIFVHDHFVGNNRIIDIFHVAIRQDKAVMVTLPSILVVEVYCTLMGDN